MRWWSIVFRDPKSGENGGSGTQSQPMFTSQTIKEIARQVAEEPDLSAAVDSMIARNGNDQKKGVAYAIKQAYKARRQRDEALAENRRVAPLVASDRDVLLRGDDATHYNAVITNAGKAGLSLADLAKKVETLPQIEQENTHLKLSQTASEVADAHKLNKAALSKAVSDDGMTFFQKDVTTKFKGDDGKDQTKTEKVWHVRKHDEKDEKGVPVAKYVEDHVFKSAIMSRGTQTDASSSVEWPTSTPSSSTTSGDAGASDLVSGTISKLNERAKQPSALNFAFGTGGSPPHSGAGPQQDATRK